MRSWSPSRNHVSLLTRENSCLPANWHDQKCPLPSQQKLVPCELLGPWWYLVSRIGGCQIRVFVMLESESTHDPNIRNLPFGGTLVPSPPNQLLGATFRRNSRQIFPVTLALRTTVPARFRSNSIEVTCICANGRYSYPSLPRLP
jgi:hypothetical protein